MPRDVPLTYSTSLSYILYAILGVVCLVPYVVLILPVFEGAGGAFGGAMLIWFLSLYLIPGLAVAALAVGLIGQFRRRDPKLIVMLLLTTAYLAMRFGPFVTEDTFFEISLYVTFVLGATSLLITAWHVLLGRKEKIASAD